MKTPVHIKIALMTALLAVAVWADAITLSNRGRAYARMGDYDKAVADFEAAAKLDPNSKLIKQNLERAKKREKGL
jgi:tetratricopeptide (TPR) repeat protein